MPADTGGSTGTRTTKAKGIGNSLGRAASRVASTSGKSGARKGYAGGRRSKSSGGGSSRGYSSNSSKRRSSGGGGGGYSGGGGGGSAKPSIPSLAAYLNSDSAYQQSVRGGKRSLTDFLSETGRRRGEATTQYNQTRSTMERDRTTQLEALKNEFASRGLIQSGLFGEEQGRFEQTFTDQMNAIAQQQAALMADILAQETNYRRENELMLESARQEAIQRRAAKYKIGA